MQRQIADKEAAEAKLRDQNALLKKELDGWRTTGSTVMKREAEVVRLIQQKANGTMAVAESGGAGATGGLAQTLKRYVFNSGEVPLGTTATYVRQFVIMGLFALVL